MTDLKKRIHEKLSRFPMVCLATASATGKPWVRYVMARPDDDLTLRIATSAGSRKVAQIRENPQVHVTCGVTDLPGAESYLQIEATAEVSTDPAQKRAFWDDRLLSYFSGPDDEKFAVITVRPHRIELMSMTAKMEVWEG